MAAPAQKDRMSRRNRLPEWMDHEGRDPENGDGTQKEPVRSVSAGRHR